jgi:ubiquinol-cytochrome c reductase iron-sulfur subunit
VCFTVSIAAAVGLGIVYVTGGDPQLEGALLAACLGGIGVGLIVWAKTLFPPEHARQERPVLVSESRDREAFTESLTHGEQEFGRRAVLVRLLALAGAALGAALLFPIRSLGPTPGDRLRRTAWSPGARLVTAGSDRPVHVDDLAVGGVLTVFPEGQGAPEDSAVVLIRVREGALRLPADREEWAPMGFVAYSKICTHVGCPVGLYQESTQRLVCPCHQSQFDVLDGAEPVFGPAVLPLQQLPLGIAENGELFALDDFAGPVGPSFWNRDL